MPKVGSGKGARHFSYSPKGRAAANAYARATGKKVTNKKKKK